MPAGLFSHGLNDVVAPQETKDFSFSGLRKFTVDLSLNKTLVFLNPNFEGGLFQSEQIFHRPSSDALGTLPTRKVKKRSIRPSGTICIGVHDVSNKIYR